MLLLGHICQVPLIALASFPMLLKTEELLGFGQFLFESQLCHSPEPTSFGGGGQQRHIWHCLGVGGDLEILSTVPHTE